MYQIYSLIGIMVMTWAIAIWASFPEEEVDRIGLLGPQHASSLQEN